MDHHGVAACLGRRTAHEGNGREGRQMKREYTVNGLLPNEAGYARMLPLVETGIQQAINQ